MTKSFAAFATASDADIKDLQHTSGASFCELCGTIN